MKRTRTLQLAVVSVAAALTIGLSACGSDSDGATTTTKAEKATTTTAAMDDGSSSSDAGTIVDVAAGNEDFSTLVAAVKAADLVDTLSGEGPFTVFAPTNEAFEALPAGTLDSLLEPANKDKLAAILTYHVVAGKVMAADLSDGQKVKTVQGEELTVGVTDDGVTLTDANGNTVNVTKADIEADNGVIHVIDGVVTPAS